MKNNKNVRKDNLSPVENGSKRIYKMYKSKKNWVVAPVVLLTLLGAVAPAPIALTNVVNAETQATDLASKKADAKNNLAVLRNTDFNTAYTDAISKIDATEDVAKITEAVNEAFGKVDYESILGTLRTDAANKIGKISGLTGTEITTLKEKTNQTNLKVAGAEENDAPLLDNAVKITVTTQTFQELANEFNSLSTRVTDFKTALNKVVTDATALAALNATNQKRYDDAVSKINATTDLTKDEKANKVKALDALFSQVTPSAKATDSVTIDGSSKTFADAVDTLLNDDTYAKTFKTLTTEFDKASGLLSKADITSTDVKKTLTDAYDKAVKEKDLAGLLKLETDYWNAYAKQSIKTADVAFGTLYTTSEEKTALVNYYIEKLGKLTFAHNGTSDKATVDGLIGDFNTDRAVNKDGMANYISSVANLTNILTAANADKNLKPVDYANKVAKLTTDYLTTPLQARKAVDEIIEAAKTNLEAERKAAIEKVNATTSLSDQDKVRTVNALKAATTVDYDTNPAAGSINKILKDIPGQYDALATKVSDINTALKNTDITDKLNAIKAAKSEAEANQKVDAALKALVDGLDTSLQSPVLKEQGNKIIDLLSGLTAADKVDYKDQLKNAENAQGAIDVLKAAVKTNTNATALDVKRAEVSATLESKKQYLTDGQVKDYTAKIAAATNVNELDSISENIGKVVKKAKDLIDEKNKAIPIVKGLEGLSSDQLKSFIDQINAAASPEEVDNIRKAAESANLDGLTDLTAYQTAAKTAIESLENKGLTTNQVDKYKAAIDAAIDAKDLAAAKEVYADALSVANKALDDKLVKDLKDNYFDAGKYNEGLEKAKALNDATLKAEWTKKFQEAADLANAKTDALETINDADYLTTAEKEAFAKDVKAAKDTAAVQAVLDKANEKAPATTVALYRAYNPNSGEHLYTKNKAEYDFLVSLGWKAEGDAWKAASKGVPVYRLYNPNSGEHFYTTSTVEYDAVAKAGWNKEGVAFYSDANKGVEVYRLFNPNAKGAGSHHYTTNAAERDMLMTQGWKYENVAFYGLK